MVGKIEKIIRGQDPDSDLQQTSSKLRHKNRIRAISVLEKKKRVAMFFSSLRKSMNNRNFVAFSAF